MDDRNDPSVWTDTIESGPSVAPRRRLRGRKAVAAAGLFVAGIAAGSAGIAAAAGSTPTPTPSTSGPATSTPSPDDKAGGHGLFGRGGPGRHGMLGIGGVRGALHGEFTVPKDGGGYQTMVVQRGKATAVSASSITIKSDDGFSATYVVDPKSLVNAARDGLSTIKIGNEVNVLAVKAGSTNTVVMLGDATLHQDARDKWGPGKRLAKPPAAGSSSGVAPANPSDFSLLES